MTVKIDWSELAAATTTEKEIIAWDVPHEIYKSTSSIDPNNPGTPIMVLPPYETIAMDEDVSLNTTYYYRIGELRPGGRYVSEQQIKIRTEEIYLKIDALIYAQKLYGDGSNEPLTHFEGEIPPEWFWDGNGDKTAWLNYYANDVYVGTRYRDSNSQSLGRIVVENDRRNYPPGMTNDYKTPFFGKFYLVENDEVEEAPTWWGEYWLEVDTDNYPDSWHAFWQARLGDSDNQQWYNDNWT